MKVQRIIDREIEAVKFIIYQLERCLEIYQKKKMHDEVKITLNDIQTCQTELNRLKRNLEQGEAIHGAKIQ